MTATDLTQNISSSASRGSRAGRSGRRYCSALFRGHFWCPCSQSVSNPQQHNPWEPNIQDFTKLTMQHRPGPVPDQEHQQQRVHGPSHPHHPLRHHLLLPGPDPPVPAHPTAEALLGRGAPRRAEADLRPWRVCHPAAADPRRARARRGGRGHRERDDKDEPARLRSVEGERGEYKPDPPPQSVYMCICLAESC